MDIEKRITLIKRPNKLAKKVPRIEGVTADQLIQRANTRVAKVAVDYEDWVQNDLRALEEALTNLANESQKPGEHAAIIYKLASDIRNQGAVCGYPLVSDIAEILCRFVDGRDELGPRDLDLVQTQIAALRTIIGNRMQDTDTSVAQTLLRDLKVAAANLRGEAEPAKDDS